MFDAKAKAIVENARVYFPRLEGQGVLVPGNFILTAAHCIHWECSGGMVLGDFNIEEIQTTHGSQKVTPLAVEPVADIAVLGSLDNQQFPDEADEFKHFCEATRPVPVFNGVLKDGEPIPAAMLANKRERWIEGTATAYYGIGMEPHKFWFDSEGLEGGDSGGPIINEAGQLIGLASHGNETGSSPRPNLALPVWVLRQIFSGE